MSLFEDANPSSPYNSEAARLYGKPEYFEAARLGTRFYEK
jgi:ubiquitin-protein ligase